MTQRTTVDVTARRRHRFTTEIELHGTTATGFQVPLDVVRALGPGKKPKVLVTIGPHTYRSTVAVYGGVPMLPLSAENRTAAGVTAGETVEVGLALDTMERTVDVPADLAAALAERDGARESFDVLHTAGSGRTYRPSRVPRPPTPGRGASPGWWRSSPVTWPCPDEDPTEFDV